jgi:hypothetical protein
VHRVVESIVDRIAGTRDSQRELRHHDDLTLLVYPFFLAGPCGLQTVLTVPITAGAYFV